MSPRAGQRDGASSIAGQLTPAGLAHFAEVAASHVGPNGAPGLVALVARGDQIHVEALGRLAIDGQPMRRDSLFRISSTTKPITGAATLALVDEGRIGLEDPIDRWLPEMAEMRVLARMDGPLDDTVPTNRQITVRDLLTFTHGFGMAMEMFSAFEPWPVVAAAAERRLGTIGPPNPDLPPDPDTWIASLGSLPLLAQPGERWLYSTGAQVLGVLAARVAGMPFADVLTSRLFEPLGMADTAFWTADVGRLATAYMPTAEGLEVWDPPDGQWSRPPAFVDGAGGLISTADDLLAFARMLMRGGDPVLPAGLVAEMTRDQLTPEQRTGSSPFLDGLSWGFCQSVVTEGPFTGAFGWDGGLGTSWLVDPDRDLIVIVLTQIGFGSPEPPTVHRDLRSAALAAVQSNS